MQINSIKNKLEQIPILKVADALGIPHRGKSAKCFMHDDKNPSMGFNPSKNTWKCYACNEGGNQITLVMKKLGIPYIEACKWLADRFNIIIPNDDGYRRRISVRKPKSIFNMVRKEQDSPISIDCEIISWIVNNAGLSDLAKDFLFKQRKYSPEVVKDLNIGSISDASRLVEALINHFGEERVLKTGIVRLNSQGFYLFFCTPCLIFPYTDIEGNIINIQTRYLGTRKDVSRFQFLPGTTIGIFNMHILSQTSRIEHLYISEGVTDCIALLSSGKKAIAIPSATLLKNEAIRTLSSKNLFMYPDNDEPGNKLFEELYSKLKNNYSHITRLELPNGFKDYSEYYLSMQ